jgi:serine/threonine protein phosphatase 1
LNSELAKIAMPSGRVPRMQAGLRIYAIGDVHGRMDKLEALEHLISWDAKSATVPVRIIMTGDYVDRGPQSRQVIEHIIKTQVKDGRIALRGNHDFYMPFEGASNIMMMHWCQYGGLDTLLSYGIDITRWNESDIHKKRNEITERFRAVFPLHHRNFLISTPLTARLGDYLFVHAGIEPGVSLEQQVPKQMLTIREPFLSSDVDHGCVVVHGHTVTESVEAKANRIGIDTGACFGGKLTALALEEDRRWVLQA